MKPFVMYRFVDVTGVSGEDVVAEGVEWTDGSVTIRWFGDHPSTVNWNSIDDAVFVHGHDGKTRIFYDTRY